MKTTSSAQHVEGLRIKDFKVTYDDSYLRRFEENVQLHQVRPD